MIVRRSNLLVILVLAILLVFSVNPAAAAKPIVLGCPLSTAYLYGWDAERAITLAVEEINAAGGVTVGKKMRPFKVEVIDTRDLEPGVPVSEALLAVEKLILNKRRILFWEVRSGLKRPWLPCRCCPGTKKYPF